MSTRGDIRRRRPLESSRRNAFLSAATRLATGCRQKLDAFIETFPQMRIVVRLSAWSGVALLALLSWTPGHQMVRTGLSGLLEHFVAYMLVAAAFVLGYPAGPPWRIAFASSVYATVLEAGPFIPGRHPGLLDWMSGVVGILATVVIRGALRPRDRAS